MNRKTLAIMAAMLGGVTLVAMFVMGFGTGNVEARVEPDAPALAAPAEGPIRYATRPMPIVGQAKWDAHLRTPADDTMVERLLRRANYIPADATAEQVEATVEEFKRLWQERQPQVNPDKWRQLLENERRAAEAGVSPKAMGMAQSDIKVLTVLVEFTGTDVFSYSAPHPVTPSLCIDMMTTTVGPLHNEIPPPGPRDNNTVWFEDATPELYHELYFGVGPTAGIVITHPNLGRLDLRGNTVANYYLEQSEGTFAPTGTVYSEWLQVDHSEGWYGTDSCETGSRYLRRVDFIHDTVDALNADDPIFPWQDFDSDGDGKVDNFTIIHAGMGQEGGGGPQGDFAIWSHAGSVDWPMGYLVCTQGSTGCPDRDIYVLDVSVDPENFDVGVGAEEYGHVAFGLPDIYTTDYSNSVAFWAIMSGGAWNGPLGGMQPAPFPGWFRYTVGWWDPVELAYTTTLTNIVVGQHSLRPGGTEQGIKIDLPDVVVQVDNEAGTGNGWWSSVGDEMMSTLEHDFDLTAATAPVTFSVASYWSIEEDWDYGYVQVSTGTTWTSLPDLGGIFVDTDPNGTNRHGWGVDRRGRGHVEL